MVFHVDGGGTQSKTMDIFTDHGSQCASPPVVFVFNHPSNHCIPLIQIWVGAWCDRKSIGQTGDDCCAGEGLGWAAEKSSKKGVNKQNISSAHKPDGIGGIKEHAPRSEHVHLHQDIGHIHENHLQATLLPQLSKYAHASEVYLHCA